LDISLHDHKAILRYNDNIVNYFEILVYFFQYS
jgi:hypothetical protein